MLAKHIVDFVAYLREVKQYSKHTTTSYHTDLEQFRTYLVLFEIDDVQIVSHVHIRSWVVALMESNISAKSVNRKISSLRTFFSYLKRQEIVLKNPMQKVSAPKIPKRLPKYVDQQKISQILDDPILEKSHAILREHLVISLFYHTGIRRSELIGLKLEDVDLTQKQIKVLGKGNKERLIPLNKQIVEELSEYIEVRNRTFGTMETSLILTDKGKAAYPKLIYNIVSKVLKKYNASDKTSPHVLRHTFATHLTANGAELNAIKELLGHSSLAATQIYTHNSIERLKEVYDKSHPKSKKSQ